MRVRWTLRPLRSSTEQKLLDATIGVLKMQKRSLGVGGPDVSAIGLGCMGMAHASGVPSMYGPVDDSEALDTLREAMALGVNLWDTAELYGPYQNEELLGRAIVGHRSEVFIATKFGFAIGPDGNFTGADGRPENVHRAVEGSLRRLGVETIDLLYQHRLDPKVPIEETVGAMADLVRVGKVRYLGLSEVGPGRLRRAHAVHPISALQSEWSLWERGIEGPILDACRELGVAVVPFCPLGRGFLTGTARRAEDYPETDYRRHDPRFQGANFDANQAMVAAVGRVARGNSATAAQVALAWLLAQGPNVIPIPGAKRRAHLRENASAADLRLTADDLAELDRAAPRGAASGARYAAEHMAMVER
jgi:aryl-alcohol dehydrogenase-like predicted oxidoreductase